MTKAHTYGIGDKVRILDARRIVLGPAYFSNGDITEVVEGDDDGYLYLAKGSGHGGNKGYLCITTDELSFIEPFTFKIGDKVRANKLSNERYSITSLQNKFEGVVTASSERGIAVKTTASKDWNDIGTEFGRITQLEANCFDLIESAPQPAPKPTKNQRITALEAQVAELAEKVAKLESKGEAEAPAIATPAEAPSKNAQRSEIIAEAKQFVKNVKEKAQSTQENYEGNAIYRSLKTVSYLTVKPDEREVIAVVKGAEIGTEYNRASAVCDSSDVFNVDIGRAIALGRAYGLDVARFENAVQPDVPTEGMVVEPSSDFGGGPYAVKRVKNGKVFDLSGLGWITVEATQILEDTDAKYDV